MNDSVLQEDHNDKNNNDDQQQQNPSKKSKKEPSTNNVQQHHRAAGGGGIIVILNLPTGTSFSLNGVTRTLSSKTFVGIKDVYHAGFHLIVIRKPSSSSEGGGLGGSAIGFVIFSTRKNKEEEWAFVREYNAHTEEPNPYAPDDTTTSNLLNTIRDGNVNPNTVISFQLFASEEEEDALEKWNKLTNFISSRILLKRNLKDGMKILPAGYSTDEDELKMKHDDSKDRKEEEEEDGSEVSYPPIPCLHPSISLHLQKHVGTRKFLSSLNPSERNYFFLNYSRSTTMGGRIFMDIFRRYYDEKWEDVMGDLQLAFVLFLFMGCLSSLEHWRDLISMLSYTSSQEVQSNSSLYTFLIQILTMQLSFIEHDFFDEMEYSEGNFLVPALQRLCDICSASIALAPNDELKKKMAELVNVAHERFKVKLSSGVNGCRGSAKDDDDDEEEEIFEVDMENGVDISGGDQRKESDDNVNMNEINDSSCNDVGNVRQNQQRPLYDMNDESDDDDDEDGPTIVPNDEIEASLARLAAESQQQHSHSSQQAIYNVDNNGIGSTEQQQQQHRQQYPLLYAAMAPQEDIVMTCARVLDEAVDVSLVREASLYLEEVEAFRGRNMIE